MGLKITDGNFFMNRYLAVNKDGIKFLETALTGGQHKFKFRQIDCVLLSPSNLLSIQVGTKVFSLNVKPNKPAHQKTIQALIDGVRNAA